MRQLSTYFLLASLGAPLTAQAADVPLLNPTSASEWVITLGATPQLGPKFDGSNIASLTAFPAVSWRRANETEGFSAPDDGLEFTAFSTDRFAVGAVGSFRAGRYRDHDRTLIGLRKVPWSVEGGVYAEFWPIAERLRARSEIRYGFHGHEGFVADVSVDWVETFGKLRLSGGPRMEIGDSRFMNQNFGINAAEAAINGRVTPYTARGGVKSVGLMAAVNYRWSDAWNTTLYSRFDRLVSVASNSPIVKVLGQRDQLTIGATATYSFKIGF